MTAPYKGKYTESNIYSFKKRFYIMQAQRNTPILDSEIREMSRTNVELTNWLARNTYGKVATLSYPYSEKDGDGQNRNRGFSCGPINSGNAADSANGGNFKVYGGSNSNGDNSQPAVLYLDGWYLFLSGDIEYSDQGSDLDKGTESIIREYPGESLPTAGSSDEEKQAYVLRSDSFNTMATPILTGGNPGHIDLIYVELTFDEVTSSGTSEEYVDPGIEDPVLGNPSANRVRATASFLVKENWTGATDRNVFSDVYFSKGTYPNGVSYIRAPLSLVTRDGNGYYTDGNFKDLLGLYDKRVYPPEELSYRIRHGGFTADDVEAGIAGAIVDEKWGATGRNEGLGTEAYNTDSVTPRALKKDADYRMRALAIAGTTGAQGATGAEGTIQPDPDGLEPGELTAKKVYADKIFLRGTTQVPVPIEGARGLVSNHLAYVDAAGMTGVAIRIRTADEVMFQETRASVWKQLLMTDNGGTSQEVSELDYKGRLSLGGEVDQGEDYHLDVVGKTRLQEHVDFEGDTNLFHHNVGASGRASLNEVSWDKQINLFEIPANDQGEKAYRLLTCFMLTTDESHVSFVLHITAQGYDGGDATHTRLKISYSKDAGPLNSTPSPLKVVALGEHGLLMEPAIENIMVTRVDTSGFVRVYWVDEDTERRYSYKMTDVSKTEDALLVNTPDATWVPITTPPLGTLLEKEDYFTYSKGSFAELRTEKLVTHTLVIPLVPGEEFGCWVASRTRATGVPPLPNHQSFHITVRDINGDGRLDSHFKVTVQRHGNDANLFLENVVPPSNGFSFEQGAYRVSLKDGYATPGGEVEYIYIYLKDEVLGASNRDILVDVSEELSNPKGGTDYPFMMRGRSDKETDATHSDRGSPVTEVRAWSVRSLDRVPAALSTNGRVQINKDGVLDFTDYEVEGATGVAGGRVKDTFRSLGEHGQYLSAYKDEISGVKWSNTPVHTVETVAALREVDPELFKAMSFRTLGYWDANDGGGGLFTYDPTATVDDDGGVYLAYEGDNTNTGRFVKHIYNNVLSVYDYGATIEGPGLAINRTVEIKKAAEKAEEYGYDLIIPSPRSTSMERGYLIREDVVFPPSVNLHLGSGVVWYWDIGTRPRLVFLGKTEIGGMSSLRWSGRIGPRLIFHPQAVSEVRPEWWGASVDEADNSLYLNDMYTDLTDSQSVPGVDGGLNQLFNGMPVVFGNTASVFNASYPRFYKISADVEIKTPTKFIGSSGISVEDPGVGGTAKLTVSAEITATDTLCFLFRRKGTQWYPYDGVSLDWNTSQPINVRWFGVEPGLGVGSIDGESSNYWAIKMLLEVLKRGTSSKVRSKIFFPKGKYALIRQASEELGETYPRIQFKEIPVIMGEGASLYWEKTMVEIDYLEGGDRPLFCFDELEGSPAIVPPMIGNATLYSEWFRGGLPTDDADADAQVLKWSTSCLMMSSWTSNSLEETLSEQIQSAASGRGISTIDSRVRRKTLDGGGVKYQVVGEDIALGAMPAEAVSPSITSTDFTITNFGVANFSFDFSDSIGGGVGSITLFDTPTKKRVYNFSIQDCLFSTGGGGVIDERIKFNNGTNTLIEGCTFSNVKLIGVGGSNSLLRGVRVRGCHIHESILDLSSFCRYPDTQAALGSGEKDTCFVENNYFYREETSIITPGAVNTAWLQVGGTTVVRGNLFDFKAPTGYGIDGHGGGLLYALWVQGPAVVSNNVFNNTKIVKRTTLWGRHIRSLQIQGNKFSASFITNRVPTYGDTLFRGDTFIEMHALDTTGQGTINMYGVSIQGNDFRTVGLGDPRPEDSVINVEGNIYYSKRYEAINVIEGNGLTRFNDERIIDVIVKDNTGGRDINVRATELVEQRVLQSDDLLSSTATVPLVAKDGATILTGFTRTRLVGYPRRVVATITPVETYRSCILTCSIVGTQEVQDLPGKRHSVFSILTRYEGVNEVSGFGLPPTEGGIVAKALIQVSFITYTPRSSTDAYIDGTNTFPPYNWFRDVALGDE